MSAEVEPKAQVCVLCFLKPSLNGKVKEVEQNNFILMHAIDDVEKETKVIHTKFEVISHQEYVCNFCDLVYPNEDELQNHTRKDHGKAHKKR